MFISSFLFIIITVVAIGISLFLYPIESDSNLPNEINIIENDETVEKLLKRHKNQIGKDYDGYRGHIYRVLTYANHFLHNDNSNRKVISAALVYHDIGLWTNHSLAYLEPSCEFAKKMMKKAKFESRKIKLAQEIIYWHHKLTDYDGSEYSLDNKIINAVRKADWIDASLGFIHYGMPTKHFKSVMQKIPNNGFHKTLIEFGPRLRGWNVYAIVTELGSIFKF
jgi:hypothetical protein